MKNAHIEQSQIAREIRHIFYWPKSNNTGNADNAVNTDNADNSDNTYKIDNADNTCTQTVYYNIHIHYNKAFLSTKPFFALKGSFAILAMFILELTLL